MPPLPLLQFAEKCEDAASGLHRFRDALPQSASRIAAIVSEFFAISAVLRHIHGEGDNRNYGSSFYQIHADLAVAFRTLSFTLEDIFDVFVKVGNRPANTVWEDLHYRLELEQSYSLAERLKLYHDFFDAQFRILEGQVTANPEPLRQSIYALLEAQDRARHQSQTDNPRPRQTSRPPMHRLDTPVSPSMYSDEWDTEYFNRQTHPAPEPPQQPLSPTYTSGSSQTMGSSQTSYSGGAFFPAARPALTHWSLRVFDGRHPMTVYRSAFRSNERSICYGNLEQDALRNLTMDGFRPALRVVFEAESLSCQFYWRVTDHRVRILIAAKDSFGNLAHYCQPLTNLKVVRDRSSLQLCRARRDDGQYTLWARLNFYFHERMVLFYSTFVAMKRQDSSSVIHRQLADDLELQRPDGEHCQFSGQIKHNGMLHAIRIFQDRGSGVVRLEAAALRGSKRDVPVWTAFITKYVNDPDWAGLECGIISLALKPPPYMFVAQYEPPRDRHGNYVLPFTSDSDAEMFMGTWAQICGSYGRLL